MEKLSNNSLIQAQCIYVPGKYDCSSVLHPIHTSYRFLITRRRAPPTRKRGEKARSFGVVSWVSLLARFALLLIFDQDDVSRCQQVRPIVPRLFLTRKSARNDPPHASDISDFRRLSFSLALSFFLVMKSSIFFTRKIVEYTYM